MKLNELWQRLFPGKLKQKGALFVEYGMILAFVIVVGVVLVGDKTMSSNVNSIFDKTAQMLGLAAEGKDGEKKQAVDWESGSYKELGYNVKQAKSEDVFKALEANGGFISSADAAGIASMKAYGIAVPSEGGGNWVLQSINDGKGYEFTWTMEDTSNTKAGDTVKSVSYKWEGGESASYIAMGSAQVAENGLVNTGTQETGRYTIGIYGDFNRWYDQAETDMGWKK